MSLSLASEALVAQLDYWIEMDPTFPILRIQED